MSKVWYQQGSMLFLKHEQNKPIRKLENKIYSVGAHPDLGWYLAENSDGFEFDYKLYGLETSLIKRTLKYYNNTQSGNLGLLLNGLKGTGKTVTAKIIANSLKQPIIVVTHAIDGIQDYINSIPQNITIIIDEYEKIYKERTDFLTIMDGAMNSDYRRVFILTTNNLYVDKNLLDRPSRIRYLKKFGNLTPSIVAEIVDDCLVATEFREDCLTYISMLEIITIDIVKSIIAEVNILEESPFDFMGVFNVSMKSGKYKISLIKDNKKKEMAEGVTLNYQPDFSADHIGYHINGESNGERLHIGDIKKVLSRNKIIVGVPKTHTGKKNGANLPVGEHVLLIEHDYQINSSYQLSEDVSETFNIL